MIPPSIRASLAQGETALADVQVTTFAQGSAIGGKPRPGVGMDWSPLVGGLTVNDRWFGGALAGYSAGGEHGSIAAGFARVLEDLGHARLLLTTHRVALYPSGQWDSTRVLLAFSIDRRALTEVGVAPRLFQHGRLRLQFADGSWAMAMAGVLLPIAARRFARIYRESR